MPLLTTRDVADRLRIPVTTLYQWRTHGTGPPSFRVGKHIRYDEDKLGAWLREQEQTGARDAEQKASGF